MGLLQPSFGTTLTIKNYTGGGGTEKTIEEIITLMKAINSNFNIFYFDPYNYPYIVGGAVCPADTTDIYMINEEKYTQYTNMVGIRGEKNGVAVNVIPYNSMSPMYQYNQYGNAMIAAGVAHNFTGATFDGNSYSIANGNYQNDFIFLTTLECNIYINGNKIGNWKNVDWEMMDPIHIPTGLKDEYIVNYNYDYPISSGLSWDNFKSYVKLGTTINISFGPFVTINFKYGSLIYGSDGYGYIAIRDNEGNVITELRGLLHWLSTTELYILAGIDEEKQEGRLGLYSRPQSGYGSSIAWNNISTNRKAYEFITQNALGAKVKVNYYLPNDEYAYAKITYKQNTSPIDQNDGDSVDIDPSSSSVNIEGLEENETYWFTIFTDKSESEAFEYTVEVDPVPPEYKTYIDNINGTGFDWIRELEQDTATITNSDRSTFTADMYKYYPMNKVTWYTYSHQGTDIEYWNKTTFAGQTTALFVSSKIDKVEINSNNNVYSCTITKNNENSVTSPDRMFVYEKNVTMGGVYTKDTLPRGWYANFNYHSDYLAYGPNCNPFYLAGSWSTRTFSGTLTEVFEQLQRYVRNIDIYVDGVLWSKAGK